jgi:RecB family endonuclease NucS
MIRPLHRQVNIDDTINNIKLMCCDKSNNMNIVKIKSIKINESRNIIGLFGKRP